MERHGRSAAAPQSSCRAQHGSSLRAWATGRRAPPTRTACWPIHGALTSRATRSAATITRSCGAACATSRKRSRHASARSAIACSSTAPPCSRRRSRATRVSAGSASTRICSIARQARGSCSASCSRICRCRSTRPSPSTAARAALVSTSALRRRSSRRTSSTRAAAFRISRSSCAARSPNRCAR